MRTTEKGQKPGDMVKWSMMQKSQISYTNLWDASPCSSGDISFSTDKKRYHTMRCPAESWWFESFTRGLRIRMGDIIRHNQSFAIQEVIVMIKIF